MDKDIQRWDLLVKSDIIQAASEFIDSSSEDVAYIIDKLGLPYIVNMVSRLGSDMAAGVLRNIPDDLRQGIINRLSLEKAADIKEILSYPAGTTGALMAKEFFAISSDLTIKQAIDYLHSLPYDKKGKVSYIYVVDINYRIEGVIQIRDLILCPPHIKIKSIARKPVVQVEADIPQYVTAKILQKHHYLGVPVVDKQQRLIGFVRTDNILKVFQEEANDDIAKSVGTGSEEIRSRSIKKIIMLRLPWLLVSIISGLLCAFISGFFQNTIQNIIALVLFIPIVLGLSESIGVQTATIIVRNIALGRIETKEFNIFLLKEIIVGVMIGLVCGAIVGAVAWLWQGFYIVGLVIAYSMVLAMLVSAIIGIVLPLLLKKINMDPAIASGPITLAFCDIQTLFIYFMLASLIFKAV